MKRNENKCVKSKTADIKHTTNYPHFISW